MCAEALAKYIGIQTPEAWQSCYAPAMEAYRPDWLDKLDFTDILDYYEFPKAYYYDRLHTELALLARDTTLNMVCWLMHYILFYADASARKGIYAWGKQDAPFCTHGSDVTCVVALLAGHPMHVNNMQKRCYDQEQINFHKAGVRNSWIGQHEDRDMEGISFNLMSWGSHFVHCSLVRLGRLMYEYCPNKHPEYQAMFGDGICPIELHIPSADNGLQDQEVESSIVLAQEKVEIYFPEAAGKTKAYCVSTWLLSPQLKQMLKPDSNILKFQNRFTITKTFDGTASFLYNVFKISLPLEKVNIAALPEDTHLQREVKKHLLSGLPLQNAKGYFVR